ncbi:riboflavin synthase [Janibacter sp. GXQ6167]|uniref:riboflavin synthase n=1 Tax=Janibacter sp. GXQ6167 TaxID=3240791 RepID=UPI003526B21B
MFTGIIEELGRVEQVTPLADSVRLTVRGPKVTADVGHGASIAVDGVCLTVTDEQIEGGVFTVDVMAETLARTALADARVGSPVNLERPMVLGGRLDGHLVQGHVDGTGTITDRVPGERWEVVRIAMPTELAGYVVEKGSIAVDGISLTVVEVGDADFTVSLIPTTLALTTLGHKGIGDRVNLEVDVIAKHVERLLAVRGGVA